MKVLIFNDYDQVSEAAADLFTEILVSNPKVVIGLATGSTPIGLYQGLIRRYNEKTLDFSKVTTFNLDEYIGLTPDNPQSYRSFMQENLFRHINIPAKNTNILSGIEKNHRNSCSEYEKRIAKAGGIEIQVLGIGSDGHIAFNEPGSPLQSRTRVVTLTHQTIEDNARFFHSADEVPQYAVTMGVGTILEARKIVLIATGRNKAEAVFGAVEGPVTSMNTASALQFHQDTTVILDHEAASLLKLRDYYKWIQENEPNAPK